MQKALSYFLQLKKQRISQYAQIRNETEITNKRFHKEELKIGKMLTQKESRKKSSKTETQTNKFVDQKKFLIKTKLGDMYV